jgi:hypothetical protein
MVFNRFTLYLSLPESYVSCRQQTLGLVFLIQSAILYLHSVFFILILRMKTINIWSYYLKVYGNFLSFCNVWFFNGPHLLIYTTSKLYSFAYFYEYVYFHLCIIFHWVSSTVMANWSWVCIYYGRSFKIILQLQRIILLDKII